MQETRVPQRSDYENFFSLFKLEGKRPIRSDIDHPFVTSTLVPSKLANFSGQGGFALVYRLRDQAMREWAVRCPLKRPTEIERAHALALSNYTPSSQLVKHIVAPTLFRDALFVKDSWVDITVMPWVHGETLDELVNGKSRTDWKTLAEAWQQLVALLVAEGVAHGDLHPKNIIRATDGTLVLIDYDSFMLPGMEGDVCPVGGLYGFGHPVFTTNRANRHYHRFMDTFAGLVILLSLRALAVNQMLKRKEAEDGFVIPGDELVSSGQVIEGLLKCPEPVASLAAKLIKLSADPDGGLEPWTTVLTQGYKPRYKLNLPSVPPAPVRIPFTPLFS